MNNLAVGGNQTIGGTLSVTGGGTLGGAWSFTTNPVTFGSGSQNISTITPGSSTGTTTFWSSSTGSLGVDPEETNGTLFNIGRGTGPLGIIAQFTFGTGGNVGDGSTGNKTTVNNLFQSQFYRTPGNTYTLSGSSGASPIFWSSSNWTGSTTANPTGYNTISINSDTVSGGVLSALQILHNFGGGSAGGGRDSLLVELTNNGATAASGSGGAAAAFWTFVGSSAGANSIWYAANPQMLVNGGSANIYGAFGSEENIGVVSGAAVKYKSDHTFINLSNDRVQGSLYDTMIGISSQNNSPSSTTVGLLNAVSVGRPDGQWPLDSSSGVILGEYRQSTNASDPGNTIPFKRMIASHGFYAPDVLFSSDSINLPGFVLSGSGVIQDGGITITPTGSGATIDTDRLILTGSAISSAGTGYVQGEDVYDAYGNSWTLTTVSGGVPSVITLRNTGYVSGSAPSNPVSTTNGHGTGLTITETWTTPTTISVGGTNATTIGIGNSGSTTTINGTIKAGSSTGQSQTCTVNQAKTLIFTNGILTGGTCNS